MQCVPGGEKGANLLLFSALPFLLDSELIETQ